MHERFGDATEKPTCATGRLQPGVPQGATAGDGQSHRGGAAMSRELTKCREASFFMESMARTL
jgi:hypothetical protein